MMETMNKKTAQPKAFLSLLIVVTFALAVMALLAPLVAPLSRPSVQVGLVAAQDIQAPRAITYQSNLLTDEQRENVAHAVPPVYAAPDTTIARKQLERLRAVLAFITSVRADTYSSAEQKISDLFALEDIKMNQELAQKILVLPEQRWQSIQQEAIVVLEQIMRTTIRDDRLAEARRSLPAMVSLSLTEEQAAIVAKLVEPFVVPNSFYSPELTEAARQEARQSVPPVTRSFKTGETIVQRGRVITAKDLEALQALGLAQPQYGWKEIVSAVTLALLVIVFVSAYLRRNTEFVGDIRGLTLMVILFLVCLVSARLVIPGHTLLPYIFPLATYAMLVAVLFGVEIALITSLGLAILVAYGLPFSLEIALYYAFGSFFGILTLGRARRVMSFFLAGAAVALGGSVTAIVYRLPEPTADLIGILSISGGALLNGFASAGLTILLQFFLAQILGMTTALQLMEISRPDHPLLQYLLRNAPGTYQHSLQVSNLAEQAAERIGADTLLTRVGALYHDVGKAKAAVYYIENQVLGNKNPHEELSSEASARMIIRHVGEGVTLAQKYRLPRRIQDFILEHHGTLIARYQYVNALKAVGGDESQIDIEQFRYPGPKPRSRETAILMLADGCEARVRADRPKDETELRKVIKEVIDNRIAQGQLDNTDLTLKDLSELADSFAATLRGIYHPRIEYPALEPAKLEASDPNPTLPLRLNEPTQSASPMTTKSTAAQQ